MRGGEKGFSIRACLFAGLAALLIIAMPAAPAGAATIAAADGSTDSNSSALDADAVCSLREAVMALNQGSLSVPTDLTDCTNSSANPFGTSDTVALQPDGEYTLTISGDGEDAGATGDLDVAVDLTITGNAANRPTIEADAGDSDRAIHVPDNDSLTLQSLDLEGGNLDGDAAAGERGGGIYFQGGAPGGIEETLTLDDVVVSGQVITGGTQDRGGAIAADGGGQVTIQNGSSITGGRVGSTIGPNTHGGGIYLGGAGTDLSIAGSTVSANHAESGVRGIGGGMFVDATGDSVVNLTNATVSNNTAGSNVFSASDGFGAGIAAEPPGSPTITITGGSITQNRAAGGPTADEGLGAGIYVAAIDEPLSLSGVTVSNNLAGGQGGPSPGAGGGIYTQTDTVIQDSTIADNDAAIDNAAPGGSDPAGFGGGIAAALAPTPTDLTITGSTISDNRAGEFRGTGGGIDMASSGNLSVTDSVISGNDAGRSFGGDVGQGGGINRAEVAATPTDSVLLSVIRDNTVDGTDQTRGGGINVHTQGSFAVRQSTVSGNVASSNSASGVGGGLSLTGGTPAGSFTVENTTVHGNTAQDVMTVAGGDGGGIAVGEVPGSPTVATITHSTIATNTAEAGGIPGGGNLRTGDGPNSIVLRASIVAYGVSDAGQENCSGTAGDIDSQGFNVEGQPSAGVGQCGLDQASDAVTDPLLAGALANNGGPTAGAPASSEPLLTRAITTSSPAFNRVTSGCPPPATDEIGTARPSGGACDSGAFELFVAPTVTPPVVSPPASTPATTPTTKKKKCKKGRKLKKGKCVKKRKKRKK